MALPAGDEAKLPTSRTNSFRGRVARRGDTPASNGNVANIVTVIRILFVPVFVWLLLAYGQTPASGFPSVWRYVAAALFIIAIATDGIDGHLARGRNLITNVGIILDPIADKLLIGGALVGLSILGELWWWVTIVILVREVGITVFRFIVIRKRVIPASKAGKLKTVVQSVAISLFLLPFPALAGALSPVAGSIVQWFYWVVMALALVLTVYSGIEYLVQWWQLDHKRPTEPAAPAE